MFEQATLTDGPSGARAWTTFLGFTSQVALVSLAALTPMVWPQVLPTARFLETLAPPLPPAPPHPLSGEVKMRTSRSSMMRFHGGFHMPAKVPTTPIPALDDGPAGPPVVGIPFGMGGPDGIPGGFPSGLESAIPASPPRAVAPITKPAPEAEPIRRYREGGNFKLGALLHRSEPQYPALAKSAHISGNVDLECVVGVDGHIQEVKVKGGNPLLVKAAVDAAWQWVYAPSKLNGTPIEIVTILTFSFKLN